MHDRWVLNTLEVEGAPVYFQRKRKAVCSLLTPDGACCGRVMEPVAVL